MGEKEREEGERRVIKTPSDPCPNIQNPHTSDYSHAFTSALCSPPRNMKTLESWLLFNDLKIQQKLEKLKLDFENTLL